MSMMERSLREIGAARPSHSVALKSGLLILLGFLWAVRLAAIKAAALSGIPVHVVVAVAAVGIALFFTALALSRAGWPKVDQGLAAFYALSGLFGFLAPFTLESLVAPHLPVFVFVIIIATMPILTLILSFLLGHERLAWQPALAVGLSFIGALAILWDTARRPDSGTADLWWVFVAFGVPALYALNTVFIASRWPARVGAIHVAHAQALIVAFAALLGSIIAGTLGDLALAKLNLPALGVIVLGEGLALLVYLRITKDYGATWVSFANYVSLIFAALIGALIFGDKISALTAFAAFGILSGVALHQRHSKTNQKDQCEGHSTHVR